MRFDIRVPIGAMFMLIGALLMTYGLWVGPIDVGGAGDHNINAWWGGVMVVFSLSMLGLAHRARHRPGAGLAR